ncbi:conserved hypothetical protein [Planktothrix agardhii]|nr:conserved hypothetical protein [Planktothrix agardhii]
MTKHWLKDYIEIMQGVIAQLVEHRNGIAGVSGSSPLSSIYKQCPMDSK